MLKVGITGGIGSGKSVVCEVFRKLGVPVFNADEEARQLITVYPPVMEAIKKNFGAELYNTKGEPDKKRIASIVFADPKKLELLNSIVHPAVQERFENWLLEKNNAPYILKEAAIIFETGTDRRLDAVIAVSAPETVRIRRVMDRDGVSADEVRTRMARQMKDEEKIKRAHYIIYNDDRQMVLPQVLALHKKFTEKI